jgi:phosphoribosyl 1,2-cyclic phosphodiesterase
MGVSVSVLASGSRGNSTIVSSSRTKILVDAGISCRETFKRMRAAGDDPHTLSAILITHEHSDHVRGLHVLAKKLNIPVFITRATHEAWTAVMHDSLGERPILERREPFESGREFQIGDIEVTPFGISHDAVDPVGFSFRVEGAKIGYATDFGRVLNNMKDGLRGCDVLMIESNHDREMLKMGPYPWAVKQRIMDRTGHLSNEELAQFLCTEYDGNASYIVLAHLSEENNHPERARIAAEKALGSRQQTLWGNRVVVARQSEPMEAIQL